MLNGKKIFVVMPAYNAVRTLRQTCGELPREIVDEVLLVDDHSSDATVELAREFFQAFVNHCGLNMHINVMYGENVHHIIEACFKAVARAMDVATQRDPRVEGVMSTKGVL